MQPLFIGGCGREISADVVRDADSQLVRLWLRQGTDFIGYYTGRWWEWMDYHDPVPRIRGEIRFLEFARRDLKLFSSISPACVPRVSLEKQKAGHLVNLQPNALLSLRNLERAKGFQPSTPTLARLCSTPELRPRSDQAEFTTQLRP